MLPRARRRVPAGRCNTFAPNAWNVDFGNLQVTSFVHDGSTGLTLFDRVFDPFPGTLDSADGLDFRSTLLDDADVAAEYSNPVAIGAAAPVDDIFHILAISFADLTTGAVSGRFQFAQDTDYNIRIRLPEPAMLSLFGPGLAGFAIMVRNRRAA